ncbi:MAG: hypothetical protein ACOYNM_18220, partial [Gemmataceae bacterium]
MASASGQALDRVVRQDRKDEGELVDVEALVVECHQGISRPKAGNGNGSEPEPEGPPSGGGTLGSSPAQR